MGASWRWALERDSYDACVECGGDFDPEGYIEPTEENPDVKLTDEELEALYKEHDGVCASCRRRIDSDDRDHWRREIMDRDITNMTRDILKEIGLNDDQMWYVETLLDNLEGKIEAYRHEIGEMKKRGYTREKS